MYLGMKSHFANKLGKQKMDACQKSVLLSSKNRRPFYRAPRHMIPYPAQHPARRWGKQSCVLCHNIRPVTELSPCQVLISFLLCSHQYQQIGVEGSLLQNLTSSFPGLPGRQNGRVTWYLWESKVLPLGATALGRQGYFELFLLILRVL